LRFTGMWNISFIILWPLLRQSYCNISMKYGINIIINLWTFFNSKWKSLFTFELVTVLVLLVVVELVTVLVLLVVVELVTVLVLLVVVEYYQQN
jgi:phosphatidylglycerophosphate synthase